MSYTFGQFIAIDSNGNPIKNAVGNVYDPADTAYATPLTVTDLSGTPITDISTDGKGYVGQQFVSDIAPLMWRSGGYPPIKIWSPEQFATAAADSAAAAQDAQAAAEAAAANAAGPAEDTVRTVITADLADTTTGTYSAIDSVATSAAQPVADSAISDAVQPGGAVLSVTDNAYAGRVSRAQHAPALNRWYPEAAGSIPAAITAANAAGGGIVAISQPTTITSTITMKAGVTLTCEGTGKITAASSLTRMIDIPVAATLDHVVLDAAGLVTSEMVRVTTAAVGARILRSSFTDTRVALYGINISGGTDLIVDDNDINGCATAIRQGDNISTKVKISNNRIAGWNQRGIYIVGSATARADSMTITRNRISDMAAGGTSRYPIRTDNTVNTNPHNDMEISYNRIYGPGTSYTDTVNPGSADQISVSRVRGLKLIGNTSLDGGDGGFDVNQCTNYTIVGNEARRADTTGLFLGSSASAYTNGGTVTGNTFLDCAQNRKGDRVNPAGIVAYGASNTSMGQNILGNDEGQTQKTGVRMTNCTNITLGPDTNAGLTTLYAIGTGNTNVVQASTSSLAAAAAAWVASMAYALNAKVTLSGGAVLQATTAGTSGATSPTPPVVGSTVVDNTVTWTRIG